MEKPSLPSSATTSPRPDVGNKSFVPASSDIDSVPLGNRSKAPVCEKCGYNGYPELLVYCTCCQDSSEHWYCLDKLPERRNEKLFWTCVDCLPKNADPVPSRKSERINDRKNQDTKVKKHIKKVMSGKKTCAKPKFHEKMAEAGHLTSNSSATTKEVGNRWLGEGADAKKELRSHKRKLVLRDGSSSDEEFLKVGKLHSHPSIKCDKKSSTKDQIDEASAIQMEFKTEMRSLVTAEDCEKEGMTGTAKSIDSLLDKKERPDRSHGGQELKKQNGELALHGNSFDEGSLIDVEDHLSVSHAYCRDSYISHCPPPLKFQGDLIAHPEPNPIWRGYFCISNEKDGYNVRIAAHLSSNACEKASKAAEDLPALLNIEILPRSDVWPVNFQISPPTNNSIGLYFFPEYERDEIVYNAILDDTIHNDLALKAVIDEVELLVFCSLVLPQEHWKFHMKYYLWGVFTDTDTGNCEYYP